MRKTDFVVTLFHGKNNPNEMTVAFVMGLNAIKQGHSATVILMVTGVELGQPGAMRGVDIGAKKEIYSGINDLAARGVAVIMVSSELPEVLGMSDRIMVVHEGHVTGIIDAATADQAKVMTLATGGSLV